MDTLYLNMQNGPIHPGMQLQPNQIINQPAQYVTNVTMIQQPQQQNHLANGPLPSGAMQPQMGQITMMSPIQQHNLQQQQHATMISTMPMQQQPQIVRSQPSPTVSGSPVPQQAQISQQPLIQPRPPTPQQQHMAQQLNQQQMNQQQHQQMNQQPQQQQLSQQQQMNQQQQINQQQQQQQQMNQITLQRPPTPQQAQQMTQQMQQQMNHQQQIVQQVSMHQQQQPRPPTPQQSTAQPVSLQPRPPTPQQQHQQLVSQTSNGAVSIHSITTAVTSASLATTAAASSSSITTTSGASVAPGNTLLDSKRLVELVQEVDPTLQVDDEVEEFLLQLADDFIEQVSEKACRLAKHRGSSTLEAKDLQLTLEREWNYYVPGFSSEEARHLKRNHVTEAHKQRMALIKKQSKKS